MLVSAVLEPSVFDVKFFDELYTIHAIDFLRGIERNGLLIVDEDGALQNDFCKRFDKEENEYELIPIKYRLRIQKYIEELLLKNKSKRLILSPVSSKISSSEDLFELASALKKDTKADTLIVGNDNFEMNRFDPKHKDGIVPLPKYRDTDVEKNRQRYCVGLAPIDSLPRCEVDDIIVRSIRYSKWLRFYDRYIGTGDSTSDFRKGIRYILTLWDKHGYFSSKQGIGDIKIYTCSAEQIRDDAIDHAIESKLERNQEKYRKIIRELINPLKNQFPWPVELVVKNDPYGIFHARYLETQHAIVRVDRGFDLFKQNGEFRRNFFTLNMAESPHLKECRELTDANVSGVS